MMSEEEWQNFVYAAFHDLREPLRSISAFAQLLERQRPEDKEAAELKAFIIDGVGRVNALIEDVLTYVRTGNSERRTMLNLGALVQWAILNLDKPIRETGAKITYHDLPEALVDESQFVQLFQQLLSNSLKYRSSEPPQIEVSAREEEDAYVISVVDNGVGVDPEYSERIFGAFKRLQGREVSGSGLGLALCRKIVEAHGGRIWVESDGSSVAPSDLLSRCHRAARG